MKRAVALLLASLAFSAMASDAGWSDAMRGVASGDAYWLKQVPGLAAVANVRQAQELEDALAAALTTNTREALGILRIIDARPWPHMIGSDIVCTPPTEKPYSDAAAFYERTRQALLSTAEGAQCLWILESSWEEFRADKARSK